MNDLIQQNREKLLRINYLIGRLALATTIDGMDFCHEVIEVIVDLQARVAELEKAEKERLEDARGDAFDRG